MTAKPGAAGVIADLVRAQADIDLPVRLRLCDVDGDLADGLRRVRGAIGQKPPGGGVRPASAPLPGPVAVRRALAAVRAVARLKVPLWPPPPPPRCELRVRGRLHSRARDQAVIAGSALAFEEGRMGVDQILAIRKAR
jgi:hypothetical protein